MNNGTTQQMFVRRQQSDRRSFHRRRHFCPINVPIFIPIFNGGDRRVHLKNHDGFKRAGPEKLVSMYVSCHLSCGKPHNDHRQAFSHFYHQGEWLRLCAHFLLESMEYFSANTIFQLKKSISFPISKFIRVLLPTDMYLV